jgi:preprotein translocase subunit SecA
VKVLDKVFRFLERKKLQKLEEVAAIVNAHEDDVKELTDTQLKAKTDEFKRRIEDGESLDDLLPEAFAVVREVAKRTLSMRHFDVQIMGGVALHQGKVAEMKTGEGKTLVATLPVYLNALLGKGVHVVTVNDYLAKRDVQWMGPIYHFLGLTVGVLQQDASYVYDPSYKASDERMKNLRPVTRREAYLADVTYGTNSEFGFDYLRDNMAISLDDIVQRGHHYAIVDEVDSILIDEARTPLIISGPSERSADLYRLFAKLVPKLKAGRDYEVDEKTRTVVITEEGVARVEEMLKIDNLYDPQNISLVNHLHQALRAHALFKKDVDYIVKNGEVIIVDEFTGRLMYGRRYSEGLHQAIEAKEGVKVREENQTLATITLQNYFRMYEKLAGMTGTAATEADEFSHIYKLEVVVIPTHKPMIRKDLPDVVYKTEDAKFRAVVEDIAERHKRGQPVLVGTISIEKSEKLSRLLRKKGIPHQVLNAKHHEREAEIIAQAGRLGAVTVATNMAGRGVDIILGGNPPDPEEAEKVKELGGLHVLGTERHEARRIDNQLRGRSGRQGDPGSSQFYLSLEDELLKVAGERVKRLMERFDFPEDQPIEHPLISKTIELAQRQIESQNFTIRKHLLEYDDVLNKQREVIYKERRRILSRENLKEDVLKMIEEVIEDSASTYLHRDVPPEDWDWEGFIAFLNNLAPLNLKKEDLFDPHIDVETLKEDLKERIVNFYEKREREIGPQVMRELERFLLLRVTDYRWKEHLADMDYLREGIGLRAMAQKDPLVEYKTEGFALFQGMIKAIKEEFLRYLFHIEVGVEPQLREEKVPILIGSEGREAPQSASSRQKKPGKKKKIGRNDPCPCGSGKKYKKCCGR